MSNTTYVFHKCAFLLHVPHLERALSITVIQEYLLVEKEEG